MDMKARVLVTMFFPAAMASPGTVFSYYLPIAAKALATDGHGVLTTSRSGSMDVARTKACKYALANGYSHLLMLDCDHQHPPDIVARLLAHDVDVVGGLNFQRMPPHSPCASERMEVENGRAIHHPPERGKGLVEVIGIGTGCLMVRLECLRTLDEPWFFFPYHDIDFDDLGEAWGGEDGGFCLRCNKAGVKIHCDTDLTSPHLAEHWVTREAKKMIPKKTATPIKGTRSTGGSMDKGSEPVKVGDRRQVWRPAWRWPFVHKINQQLIPSANPEQPTRWIKC